jgi:uncharacterized protein with HEPN domain
MNIKITTKGQKAGYAMPPMKILNPCKADDITTMAWLALLKLRGFAEIDYDSIEEETIFKSITEHVKDVICKVSREKARAMKIAKQGQQPK